jgi:4-amino-4-deoxy-L-arabinose transferase-like glycosyltransferase
VLDEASYTLGIYIYTGAALLFVLCLGWWLRRHLRALWALCFVLLVAALLLTPAYPKENVDTMAPALIVAGFQFLTQGYEAAEHAIRPLSFMCGAALVLSLLLRFTLFRPRAES